MAKSDAIDQRTRFMNIDRTARDTLRAMKPLIEA